jgi:hypothetical protein
MAFWRLIHTNDLSEMDGFLEVEKIEAQYTGKQLVGLLFFAC